MGTGWEGNRIFVSQTNIKNWLNLTQTQEIGTSGCPGKCPYLSPTSFTKCVIKKWTKMTNCQIHQKKYLHKGLRMVTGSSCRGLTKSVTILSKQQLELRSLAQSLEERWGNLSSTEKCSHPIYL